ncbi:DUF418 domain-containing protein [Nocardia sp. 2]|uniref:DUF418 domain-containing protein n=1 Tax=Nocardia acididurans TaxID=2802282 RepID=A0ABS1M8Q3_9NOCA|nr:DUF418 domain-containing protein [Nocardia acididurans]MBL1077023.1 DUF418 domain-containing protein [Nocardia acididurans]
MSTQAGSPVPVAAAGRRIGAIDTVRGFALFGILVTNTLVGTMLFAFLGSGDSTAVRYDGGFDRFVYAVLEGLFLGKFYLLFAFLFGYSFTLQIAASQRTGARPVPRLLRRSAALFLIGLAHVMLLWVGDILTLYAFLCVLLVLLRKVGPRPAFITGVVLYVLFSALSFIPGNAGFAGLGQLFDVERIHTGMTGGIGETFETQLWLGPLFMIFIWLGQGVTSLGMFLIGMAAGKRRVFEDAALLERWTPRALRLGFGVGLPVSLVTIVLWTARGELPWYWAGVQQLANPLLTLGYVAGIVWLTRSRWAGAVGRLAPAGRMAASNYIAQSVVFMLLYTGYGLALADRVPPVVVVLLALVTFAAQLWCSAWWLRRHPYGPVEWLLRAVTYLSIPAWRSRESSA